MEKTTKFILHGGYTSTPNELNRTFYEEISRSVPDGGEMLLVYFSRKEEETEELFEQDKNRILEKSGGKKLNIVLAKEENFVDQLRNAHAIYMRGGDTQRLLNVLRKFTEFSEAIKGKTVAGSSAGAYVLAKYYYSGSKRDIFEGLGILPIKIICHYNEDFSEVRELMERDYPSDLELVLLKDCEWRSFNL